MEEQKNIEESIIEIMESTREKGVINTYKSAKEIAKKFNLNNMKYINIKEFRELGYLQEINRQFLHPLGLALEIEVNGNIETIVGIQDHRNDPEGVFYDIKNSEKERVEKFLKNEKYIQDQRKKFSSARINLIGDEIEPII